LVGAVQESGEALRVTQTGLLNWNNFGILLALAVVLAILLIRERNYGKLDLAHRTPPGDFSADLLFGRLFRPGSSSRTFSSPAKWAGWWSCWLPLSRSIPPFAPMPPPAGRR